MSNSTSITLTQRLVAYSQLARIEKPVGWLLLLWPTYWGVWLASDGNPTWQNVVIFTLGVFIMRCFGCCVNDLADRKLDAQVKRTKSRPLAAGTISTTEAIVVGWYFSSVCIYLVATTFIYCTTLVFVGITSGSNLSTCKAYCATTTISFRCSI